MTVNEVVRGVAGVFVLVSLALGYWVSPWFVLFTAFVGANLLQSAFSKWCLLASILRRAGVPDAVEPAWSRSGSESAKLAA